MIKKVLIFCLTSIIILTTMTTLKLSQENNSIKNNNLIKIVQNRQNNQKEITNQNNQNQIGELIINKIKLNEPLFKVSSKENTIEQHVTILKESVFPTSKDSIIFIAAHSGTGKIAYFEDLDELKENDKIILHLNNKTYIYFVKDIYEEKKNGYINVTKEPVNQLILTTCSPKKKNYQLIVNCISKS